MTQSTSTVAVSRLVLYGGLAVSLMVMVRRRLMSGGDGPVVVPSEADVLLAAGDFEEALAVAEKRLEDDDTGEALLVKGKALLALEPSRCAGGTCRQHAAAAFADCVRLYPALTSRCKAGLLEATTDVRGIDGTTPDRVARLFDDYAATFDDHLVHELGYSAPPILAEAVAMIEKRRGKVRRVLDVGCGTGLVGKELQRVGVDAKVQGIDLSPEMVLRARRLYDSALVCDARHLDACDVDAAPDLAVLGDVLVYLDDLDARVVLRHLRHAAIIALTIERPSLHDEAALTDWRTVLGATGRFAHNLDWLVRFMHDDLDYHLTWIADLCETCPYPPLRYERAHPVRGAVVVFERAST